jgi:hypothetical protein
MYRDLDDMRRSLDQHLLFDERGRVSGFRQEELAPGAVDAFARNAIFNPDPTVRTQMRQMLRSAAAWRGIRSSSLDGTLAELGRRPQGVLLAVRLGGHCYDLARLVLRSAKARGVAGLVFEQGWAGQSPWEFSALMCAAALREHWQAPLFLRCCLPPLASDLLPGGMDSEALDDQLATALGAGFLNLTLRISPAGLLRSRSHGELRQLLKAAREGRMAISLRVDEPAAETGDDPAAVVQALRRLGAEGAITLLTVSGDSEGWSAGQAESWMTAAGARGLALSGVLPSGFLSGALARPVLEVRPEFEWAERIVMHPEFRGEHRRKVLAWLRGSRQGALPMTDSALLRDFEYQALGHFEFELWDLDGMPSFRDEFMSMLGNLYERLGLVESQAWVGA